MTITRTLLFGLLLAILIAAALGWLAYQVNAGGSTRFDTAVRDEIHAHANPALTRVMIVISDIGKPLVSGPLTILIAAFFWRAGYTRRAWLLLIAMAGGAIIEDALKLAIHRPRPQPFFGYPLPASYSFPSGHALSSFCLYGVVAALLSPSIRSRVGRALLWFAAALMIVAIGFSRIYLGVHYPTDVIAGYAAAGVWVLFISIGNHVRRRPIRRL